jgi:ABC-type transporter Mla maintaining outer membrane lipid asymmetry ATPase subunit MlaF
MMLYKGLVRMIGSREDFNRYPAAMVQQFITRSARAPIE